MNRQNSEKLNYEHVIEMLKSDSLGDNARVLAELATAHDFDERYFDLVRAIERKAGTVAFHVPVSHIATAYLVMAGEKQNDGDDPDIRYVIGAFESC